MTIEFIDPDGLFPSGTYTHTVVASGARTVYISGQVAQDASGEVVGPGDLAAQTEQVMKNLGAALAAAAAGYDDVVKITTLVVGYRPEHRAVLTEARSRHFRPDRPPASTLVGVEALARPEFLVEIEAIAVLEA